MAKTSDQTLTVTLPDDLADWLENRAAEPGRESAEASVRDLIRRDRDRAIADLQKAVDEASASGHAVSFNPSQFLAERREEYERRRERRTG